MSALPEQYQQYAAHVGQRPVYPAAVELRGERQAVTWVPSGENPNEMVCVPKEFVQPMQPAAPRDLTPQPLLDPKAQQLLAGGLGIGAAGAGLGWGAGQMFAGVAMMGTSGLAILLGLLLASQALRRRPHVSIHQEVHQHARFGRNNVTM